MSRENRIKELEAYIEQRESVIYEAIETHCKNNLQQFINERIDNFTCETFDEARRCFIVERKQPTQPEISEITKQETEKRGKLPEQMIVNYKRFKLGFFEKYTKYEDIYIYNKLCTLIDSITEYDIFRKLFYNICIDFYKTPTKQETETPTKQGRNKANLDKPFSEFASNINLEKLHSVYSNLPDNHKTYMLLTLIELGHVKGYKTNKELYASFKNFIGLYIEYNTFNGHLNNRQPYVENRIKKDTATLRRHNIV
jgi:hypothetical protein